MAHSAEVVARAFYEALREETEEARTRRIPTNAFASFFQVVGMGSNGRQVPPERLELEALYKNLRKFDHEGDTPRSIQQKQFHDLFVAASIKNIYKKKFVTEYSNIMRDNPQFGGDLNQNVIVTCPRRFGKTFGTAMFIAAYLMSISYAEVAVFSPSKRQSTMLLEKVNAFVQILGGQGRVETKNQEKLFLTGNSQRDIRKSFYYPAVVNALRGVSGKTIICEELAAMPSRVWYEVILPLLQIDDAYIIGISTIQGESNFMSKYLKQKNEFGESFFRVFQFFGVCLDCRNAGLANSCTHLDHLRPAWHSTQKLKRIKLLMEGNEDLANQELSGISSAENKRAFPFRKVQQLFQSERIDLPGFIQFIFVAIDPCGSGNSNLAICTSYTQHGRLIILGIDAIKCKTVDEAYGGISNHVNYLRNRKDVYDVLKNATLVFIVESNLGFEASHIAKHVQNTFTNLIVMNQEEKIGLHTDNKFKRGSAVLIRNQLQTEMLGLSESLFSTGKSLDDTLEQFETELTEYREIVEKSDSHFSRVKVTFTGKLDATSNDDLVLALCLNSYWSRQFYVSPEYARFHTT